MATKVKETKKVNKLTKLVVYALIALMTAVVIAVFYKQTLEYIETYHIVRQVSAGIIVGGFFIALWVGYKKVS